MKIKVVSFALENQKEGYEEISNRISFIALCRLGFRRLYLCATKAI